MKLLQVDELKDGRKEFARVLNAVTLTEIQLKVK